MNRTIASLAAVLAFVAVHVAQAEDDTRLLDSRRIWRKSVPTSTDLVRFKDRWFCVFHLRSLDAPAGMLRFMTSADGEEWEVAANIPCSRPMQGRANPRLTVSPENRLMVVAMGSDPVDDSLSRQPNSTQSWAWMSQDGFEWTAPKRFAPNGFRISNVRWDGDRVYCCSHGVICGNSGMLQIFSGREGEFLSGHFEGRPHGGPGSLVFMDDAAHCLMSGFVGSSRPPYNDWSWKKSGTRFSHPNLIRLPNGRFIASVALSDEKVRTSLCWFDVATGKLTETLELPAGREPVNVGLVLHDGQLWVSHYAPHGGEMGVYLSKVKLADAR